MTITEPAGQPSLFCRRCGYELRGLSRNRCPECGQPFDPNNRRTYDVSPHRWRSRRRERVILVTLGLVAGLLGLFEGVLLVFYRPEWKAEQAAISRIGGTVGTARIGPGLNMPFPVADWLHSVPGPFNHMLDRAMTVQLFSSNPSDEQLAALKDLRHLRLLNISGGTISNAQFVHLGALTSLEHLSLHNTHVDGAGLAHLRNLTQLRSLGLSNCMVTDAGLAHLAGMKQLQSLHVAGPISDDGLAHLRDMTRMEMLIITASPGNGPWITDAGLDHLQNMKGLRHLTLTDTRITDAGLAKIAKLSNLETLTIHFAPITDAAVQHLATMKQLQQIVLLRTMITPAGWQNLQKALPNTRLIGP